MSTKDYATLIAFGICVLFFLGSLYCLAMTLREFVEAWKDKAKGE